MSTFLYSLGHWAVRARRLVVVLWIVLLALLGALAGTLNHGLDSAITIPGTEGQTALDSLSHTFPQVSGGSAQLLVVAPDGASVEDSAYKTAIGDAVTRLNSVKGVELVSSPYSTDVTGAISDDDQAAIITIQLTDPSASVSESTKTALEDEASDLRAALPQAQNVTIGGQVFAIQLPEISVVEFIGVAVALGILVLTFGSLLAAGMPILIAAVGLTASLSVTFAATAFADVNTTAPVLALMLGLAVGIDYSLFIISRHREQLRTGMDPDESISRAIATSGSAVVFAGTTVVIALLGLSVAGIPFLSGVGIFTAVGVAMAVLASLTVLPALLGFAGSRLAPKPKQARRRRRGRKAAAPASRETGRFYRRWVRTATRHPIITVVATVLVIGSALIPAAQLRLSLPDGGSLPTSSQARQTYDLISDHFGPGYNATLIATGTIITSNDPVGLMNKLAAEIRTIPGVKAVPLATPNQDGDTGIVQIIPDAGPSDPSTEDLVTTIRGMHGHFEQRYGIDLKVTGMTAVAIDVSAKLGAALVPFGILVVGLSLILLMIVFRSVWVPIKATLGYLLSVGAAFGAVSLAYSNSWLGQVLNVPKEGPVIAFMPIIVMGVLFGLAMDYELFLVSRIREEHVHDGSAREAIETGFVGSAPVVTAAALIMFAVFASFVPQGNTTVKPMAIGLATGVLVDAFVVRMTLVPAILHLLGEHSWWMPAWLGRVLPRIDVEGEGLAKELERRKAAARGDSLPADPARAARRTRLGRRLGLTTMILVPTLLLGTTIWALWPAHQSIPATTAAIVNNDAPATVSGQSVPLGRQLAAKLVGDEVSDETGEDFDWVITDADDAAAGLDDGRYATVVTIPKGFSAAATSLSKDDAGTNAEQATINVETGSGSSTLNDAISATVTRAATALTGKDITTQYLDNVYIGFNTIHDRLADADSGATKLADGATSLADGTHQASSGAGDLASGTDQIASGASTLAGKSKDLASGAANVADGAQQTAAGAAALNDKVSQIADGANAVQQQLTAQTDTIQQLAAACPTSGAATDYCAQLSALASAAADPAASGKLQSLVEGGKQLQSAVSDLAGGTAHVAAGAAEVSTGASGLSDGASRLSSGASTSASGARSLAAAMTQLDSGVDSVHDGTTQLRSGLNKALTQVPTYNADARDTLSGVAADPVSATGATIADNAAQPWQRLVTSPLFWIAFGTWLLTIGLVIAVARKRGRITPKQTA